jgi:hypothetical protein
MREPIRVAARLKVYRGARSARWGRETLIGTAPLSRTIAPVSVGSRGGTRGSVCRPPSSTRSFIASLAGMNRCRGRRSGGSLQEPFLRHRPRTPRIESRRYRLVTASSPAPGVERGAGRRPSSEPVDLGGDRSDASSRLLARCGGRGGHPAAPASRGCPVRSLPSAPGRAAGPVPRSRGPSHRREEDRPAPPAPRFADGHLFRSPRAA